MFLNESNIYNLRNELNERATEREYIKVVIHEDSFN